jgi:hypothetical protein
MTERMRISAAGNVGIGTTNIFKPLTVQAGSSGAGAINQGIVINSSAAFGVGQGLSFSALVFGRNRTGDTSALQPSCQIFGGNAFEQTSDGGILGFSTQNSVGTMTERMRIDSSGNVGIGTTSPAAKLHLETATSGLTEILRLNRTTDAADNGVMIAFKQNAFNLAYIGSMREGAAGSDSLVFGTRDSWGTGSPSEKMRVTATGNVGIGTASPGARLQVSGGKIKLVGAAGGGAGGGFLSGEVSSELHIQSEDYTGSSFADIVFDSGNGSGTYSERARIDSSGNLLVGTTSADPSGAGSSARVVVSTANGGQAALTAYNAGTGAVNIISIENGNGQVGRIQCSGSATSYLTSSDSRLKENVKPITDNSDIIDRLAPKKFDWKTGGKNAYGFIAQEAIEVFPEAVSAGDSGNEIKSPWAMDYSKLVPILVAELQSVRARLAALEAK